MQRVINKIEEFNIDREKDFKGKLSDSTLFLVHDLDEKDLASTIKQIKSLKIFKDTKTLNAKYLKDNISKLPPSQSLIFTVHLSLDHEINTHHSISQLAFEHNIHQLNPYNKIAKIFDDKYLFYALMKANDIEQPLTASILKKSGNDKYLTEEYSKFTGFNKIMIKPRHGTEKIDSYALENLPNWTNAQELIKKITSYDDCLVQEFIDFKHEFKVLYFMGGFYTQAKSNNPNLKIFLDEFIELLKDFALTNKIIMPQVFSLDFLEKPDTKLVLLEANIRPAGIHRFTVRL